MKPVKPLNRFWNRSPVFYRIRNWLLFKDINISELNDLHYNKNNPINTIPDIYFEVNKKIFINQKEQLTDFDKAIQIATWLRNNIKGGKGLGISSDQALKHMIAGGYGVCSDFCQIFNNFCVINKIKVREWGLLNLKVEKDGHSFNEFYASELKQWILIDVSYAVYFTSVSENKKHKPLSAPEVFSHSKRQNDKRTMIYISDYQPNLNIVSKYYFTQNMQPFIIDKYRNKFYDNLLKKLDFLPIPIIHGIAIIANKSYVYKKINI
jgi:hypothetical protein